MSSSRSCAFVRPLKRAALDNMTKILKGAGVDRSAVLKCNIFLTNLKQDFAPMNEVYQEVRRRRYRYL